MNDDDLKSQNTRMRTLLREALYFVQWRDGMPGSLAPLLRVRIEAELGNEVDLSGAEDEDETGEALGFTDVGPEAAPADLGLTECIQRTGAVDEWIAGVMISNAGGGERTQVGGPVSTADDAGLAAPAPAEEASEAATLREQLAEAKRKHALTINALNAVSERMVRAGERMADARADRDRLQRTFDLRWNADQRAIDRWREAAPGRYLTRPDHADLCVWLLHQLENAETRAKRLQELAAPLFCEHGRLAEDGHETCTRGSMVPVKYAIVTVMDQTIGYFESEEKGFTTKHPEARLLDTLSEAVAVVRKESAAQALHLRRSEHFTAHTDAELANYPHFWIEVITDEAEFRAREDTW